jgi:hypothetical protein
MRARTASEVGYRPGRRDHARELISGPLHQLTMLRLVASALPRPALEVVHEAKEPPRGRHGGDASRAATRADPDAIHYRIPMPAPGHAGRQLPRTPISRTEASQVRAHPIAHSAVRGQRGPSFNGGWGGADRGGQDA